MPGHRARARPPEVENTSQAFDPLRLCIFTTIGLIAWVLGPPLVILTFSGLGLLAYVRAWRANLRHTRCFLRDPRLAMGYLATAFVASASLVLGALLRRFG